MVVLCEDRQHEVFVRKYLEKEDRTVNETTNDYPRLSKPRKCQPHVEKLAGMCRKKQLSESAPPSLLSACNEYNKRMAS